MPVEFLSDDQVAAYERFVGELSRSELEGFFLLDGTALDLIAHKRAGHHKLGLGLQVGTVRFLGRFLTEDSLDVPWSAVEYLAAQLEIADPSVVKRYTERQQTAYQHSWEIRAAYGYRDFGDAGVRESLEEFMGARAWIHAEGAVALFEQTKAWLRRERVLLPGVSVLARLVSSVREEAAQRAYRTLAQAAAGADVELPQRLRDLLEVPEGKKVSELERLRTAPRSDSGLAMSKALARVSEVLAIGAGAAQAQAVPVNRVAALARYGWAGKAPLLKGLAEPRKTATLLATARRLEAAAVDDALDLFDSLMATRLIGPARRATDRARLEAMPRLEKASATLMAVARTVLELLDGAEDPAVDRRRTLQHPLHRPRRHRATRPRLPGPRRRRRPLVAARLRAHQHARPLHLPSPVERPAAQATARPGYRCRLMPSLLGVAIAGRQGQRDVRAPH